MLMILGGEFLPTFCKIVKIVLIVMELFYDFQMIMWQPEVFEKNLSVLLPAKLQIAHAQE